MDDDNVYPLPPATPVEKFVSPEPPPIGYDLELLELLVEECAEVIQRATKAMRFGLREVEPGQERDNIERMSGEIGQLRAVIHRMDTAGLIDTEIVFRAMGEKERKLKRFMQNDPPGD